MRFSPSALLIIALLPLAACKPVVNYNPQIDPANFSATVDHPLFKLAPGSVWNFEGVNEDGDTETGRVEVLAKEKIILGIPMAVIRDQVWINGELHEDTEDWYAQDEDGNVWYFGEAVDNYEDGAIADHDGSWEAGVDGALPGITMPADPKVGEEYRQEYYAGNAEDMAKVINLDTTVTIGVGTYQHCLQSEEWNPLEPGIVEQKSYCPDVGYITLEEKVAGQTGRIEFVE